MLIPHGGYSIPHLPGPGPERAQRPYRFVFALWYFFSSSWGRFGMLRERERELPLFKHLMFTFIYSLSHELNEIEALTDLPQEPLVFVMHVCIQVLLVVFQIVSCFPLASLESSVPLLQ